MKEKENANLCASAGTAELKNVIDRRKMDANELKRAFRKIRIYILVPLIAIAIMFLLSLLLVTTLGTLSLPLALLMAFLFFAGMDFGIAAIELLLKDKGVL